MKKIIVIFVILWILSFILSIAILNSDCRQFGNGFYFDKMVATLWTERVAAARARCALCTKIPAIFVQIDKSKKIKKFLKKVLTNQIGRAII